MAPWTKSIECHKSDQWKIILQRRKVIIDASDNLPCAPGSWAKRVLARSHPFEVATWLGRVQAPAILKKGHNWANNLLMATPPDSTHFQNVVMQSFDNWCPLPGFCYECLVLLVEVQLLGFDSRHVVFQLTDLVDLSLPAVSGRNLLTHTSQKIRD